MALEHVLADLSFEEARRHLEWLSEHAPARISGTPDQERAAEYFVEQLEGVGLEARLDTFTAYRSLPLRGAFEVLAPEAREFPCEPCAHIVSTPDEGIEADLVYLGPGGKEQYAGSDVRGKAVLTEISTGPARPQKALIAARHGASAIVFANWGLAEFDTIPCGAIKCVWGKERIDEPDFSELSKLIKDSDYQTVTITKHDGRIIGVERSIPEKFDV